MDSLIVDLDKVLDDFEAEEKETSQTIGNSKSPTDYANFIAANEERPWDDISKAPVTSSSQWMPYKSDEEKIVPAVYDIPYIPAEDFDLSEADFAPSVVTKDKSNYTGSLDLKGDNLYNDYGKLTSDSKVDSNSLNYVNADFNVKKIEENNIDHNSYAITENSNVINNCSGTIDLRSAKSESSTRYTDHTAVNTSYNQTPVSYQADVNHTTGTVFVADDTNCKYPIQVVDKFTPVTEHKEFKPLSQPDVNSDKDGNTETNSENRIEISNLANMQTVNSASDVQEISQENIYATRNANNLILLPKSSQDGACQSMDISNEVKHSNDVDSVSRTLDAPSQLDSLSNKAQSGGYVTAGEMADMHDKLASFESNKSLTETEHSEQLDMNVVVASVDSHSLSNQAVDGEKQTVEAVGFTDIGVDENDASDQDIDSYLNDMYAGTSSIGELSSQNYTSLDSSTNDCKHEVREFPYQVLNSGYVTSVDIGNIQPVRAPTPDLSLQSGSESTEFSSEGVGSGRPEEAVSTNHEKDNDTPITFSDSTLVSDSTKTVQSEQESLTTCQTDQSIISVHLPNQFPSEGQSANSPSPHGSPFPSCGEGARPKEPMNRPNSLLGLSVPLDTPTKIPVKSVTGKHGAPPTHSYSEEVSMDVKMMNGIISDEDIGVNVNNVPQAMGEISPKMQKLHNNFHINGHISLEDDQENHRDLSSLQNSDNQHDASTNHDSSDDHDHEGLILRKAHSDSDPPPYSNHLSADGSEPTRPSSWAPEGAGAAVSQKRPNSLNLPPRGDFGVNSERSQAPYTFPYDLPDKDMVSPESTESENPTAEASTEDVIVQEVSDPSSDLQAAPIQEAPSGGTESPLGKVAPLWIPDSEAATCMGCDAKFTFTKRRHHCRACGKVFCSTCCNLKSKLEYMDNKEARVCLSCHQQLAIAEITSRTGRSPNPNNPSEYCSTIPPSQQVCARSPPPTVMVPVGVLKREGSSKRTEPKQVMFSDGIRPGGDLTELDGSDTATRLPPRRTSRSQKRIDKVPSDGSRGQGSRKGRPSGSQHIKCLIPEDGLPPVIPSLAMQSDEAVDENPDIEKYLPQIKDEDSDPVIFMINVNLFVRVKIINLDCCVSRVCWCFTTKGMCTVGQDEIVIVLEMLPKESTLPRDILCHFQTVYEEASKGNTVTDMGHTIFNQSFLDSRDHGGMLYIRPTFQCLHKLILPSPPYVFGILLQKWETPWAKVFPIRLLLRLGAEYRYYPCPLISVRNRKPVFFEIGHTIMNLLADFRNFQYMLPQIKGVTIHMEDKKTLMNFPRNRYDDLMKVVSSSNEHVMAIGASFSSEADSHLVCIQNDDGNYQTQAINIQNKPRKVTGASFVVFNGALKTSSGLKAKSSIVEDGLMVQITPESMAALKQAMKDMREYTVECGSMTNPAPDEVVLMQWVDDDKQVNIGVKSPVDGKEMDGIESIHIPNATDYVGENRIIRWTDVFFIQNEDGGSTKWEPVDLSRLAETLSNAFCIAVTRHLDKLKEASLTKIGLRVNIEADKVGYESGALGEKLPDIYMNDLDNELIPVIHSAASQNHGGSIILELIFHILE